MYLKYYKVPGGQSWVVCCMLPFNLGLIHLGHWQWWRPIVLFPRALVLHLRLALRRKDTTT
jgi:hypothetical protein